ncbi:amidohydrolase family protein [Micromonospora rubida]|uniref:amidohydrolase n=1 Tax=Micromonospora rubida TaxID=2697657 RepID=UPI0013780116|nr:amidohydrolase [Micromonospora rubida]NBE80058.1 amidohydrolase [Micromonospora rubida]
MKPSEDAQWRLRVGLLPVGDPQAEALRALAARPRSHRIPAVAAVDPATGRPGPARDLVVSDGGLVEGLPADGPARWYALPGFVDSHAHVSSAGDLIGLLTHGVTGYRQLWGEPAHRYTAGVHRARTAVVPRAWVSTAVVDGPGTRVPGGAMVVDDPRSADHVLNEALGFAFDGIKVYDDLEPAWFAAITAAADRVGLPVVGHAPERVPFAEARAAMWSTEHLYGLVPNVFRLPADRRWAVLAAALDRVEPHVVALAEGFAGRFACPTLVTWRALTGERRWTRPSPTALALADAGRVRAWTSAAREALGLDRAAAAERGALVDRLGGLVHALADAGARLLVGTDCGNPFVVAGPSFHKELAELHRAGLPFAALLRAATTDAHAAMRWGTAEAAADLVLYRRPPEAVAELARPDAVLVDGVLLDAGDLDELWSVRLTAAGLADGVWPRGGLDPAPAVQRKKERAGAG